MLFHPEAFSQTGAFTQAGLHGKKPQRSFYTQMLLHTDTFTYKALYAKKNACTEMIYTEIPCHRAIGRLLHTEAFAQKSAYTQERLHRSLYTEKLLHREAFTHRGFYREAFI